MTDNIIKHACKELGITQAELAKRIGVAEQTVRNWSATNKTPEWAGKFIQTLLRVQELEREKNDGDTAEVLRSFKKLLENI